MSLFEVVVRVIIHREAGGGREEGVKRVTESTNERLNEASQR